jgi:hypothetical protein
MKILLKHLKSGLFVKASGDWTAKSNDALNFVSPAAAQDYRRSHRCFLTSIIFRFRLARHDMELKAP